MNSREKEMRMLRNQKGLTLVEVLASTVILSIIILMFLNISGYSVLSNRKDDLRIDGLRLAERVLNEERSKLTSQILPVAWNYSGPTTEGPYTITVQHADLTSAFNNYDRTAFKKNRVSLQSVILFENNASLVPQLLTVTVSWEG
jgi:prepilin-type N-terminal cleavage/methylation domain-containing protein